MERWACWAVTLLPGARRSAATRRGGPGRGSGADHPGNHPESHGKPMGKAGKTMENPWKILENLGKPMENHGNLGKPMGNDFLIKNHQTSRVIIRYYKHRSMEVRC